jgi:sulfate adenylyltransferase
MTSTKRNKAIYIDTEALSSLALVQAGLISPVDGLMNKETSQEVDKNKIFKGMPLPFSFILAPSGKKNYEVISTLKAGETVDLINNDEKVGELTVEETFEIDPEERIFNIFGTNDTLHPGVKNTINRLGKMAVSGKYFVTYPPVEDNIKRVKNTIKETGAKKITAMMLAANPFNRVHERIIRQKLNHSDLIILFLRKPFNNDGLNYEIRSKALEKLIDTFLPKNKVIVIPFENTYIFAGYNELILDAIVAKNYGCSELTVGKNHGGLSLYYSENETNTIFNECKNLSINIEVVEEYVYCNICKTLVSRDTCPHGSHHHIKYNSNAILKLLDNGIIPPTILVRKEVSSYILSRLFPDRFENVQNLYYDLFPNSGLLEEQTNESFYLELIQLYQTSSLT